MPKTSVDIGRDPVRKGFIHYLLPAITGMVIKSIYVIADVMFIGHSIGPDGLAATNIVIPYFALMFAFATMVGIGGAALMGICFGEGKYEAGQEIFRQAITLITIIMVLMTVGTLIWLEEIIRLFGANDVLLPLSMEYVGTLTLFATPYAVGWVLSNFVRNDGNPRLVMNAMVISALSNIILDWFFLFIMQWGMFGAALATGIAQTMTLLILSLHFRSPKCKLVMKAVMPNLRLIQKILVNGLPTFFMEISTGLLILVSNWVLLKLGGSLYLSVYSVALNCMWFVVLMNYGVGQAVQPLVSFNHGAGYSDRILETIKLGLGLVLILCGTAMVISLLFSREIVGAFVSKPSAEMLNLGSFVLKLYGVALVPMGFNIIITTVYQAIARASVSSYLSLLRALVFPLAGLFILPWAIGGEAVWSNVLIAEVLTAIASLALFIQYRNLLRQRITYAAQQGAEPPVKKAA